MSETDRHVIRHQFALGDKIWFGDGLWGQVIDLTSRRVKIVYLDEQDNRCEEWVAPQQLHRRS